MENFNPFKTDLKPILSSKYAYGIKMGLVGLVLACFGLIIFLLIGGNTNIGLAVIKIGVAVGVLGVMLHFVLMLKYFIDKDK